MADSQINPESENRKAVLAEIVAEVREAGFEPNVLYHEDGHFMQLSHRITRREHDCDFERLVKAYRSVPRGEYVEYLTNVAGCVETHHPPKGNFIMVREF